MTDRHHFLKQFAGRRCPALIVHNYSGQWKLDHVVCAYRGGAEQAMSYLVQLGHRRIGLITAAPEIQTARDVADVYTTKLAALGAEPDESWREDGKFTEEGGAQATAKLLSRHPDLTAVFAAN